MNLIVKMIKVKIVRYKSLKWRIIKLLKEEIIIIKVDLIFKRLKVMTNLSILLRNILKDFNFIVSIIIKDCHLGLGVILIIILPYCVMFINISLRIKLKYN